MKRIRVASLAEQDLDQIWLHTATLSGNLDIANSIVDSLTDAFAFLAQTPLAGTVRREIAPDVRGFPVGKYLIYYRASGRHLLISRIIHGNRDQRTAYSRDPYPQ